MSGAGPGRLWAITQQYWVTYNWMSPTSVRGGVVCWASVCCRCWRFTFTRHSSTRTWSLCSHIILSTEVSPSYWNSVTTATYVSYWPRPPAASSRSRSRGATSFRCSTPSATCTPAASCTETSASTSSCWTPGTVSSSATSARRCRTPPGNPSSLRDRQSPWLYRRTVS